MTEILYILFYLGVLALVLGCLGYLVALRNEEALKREGFSLHRIARLHPETQLSRQMLKKAKGLSGAYRLGDLEKILTELASLQAWGLVVHLGFPAMGDHAQMEIQPDEVDLYSHQAGVIPDYLDRFRQSAERAGFEVHPIPGLEEAFFVRITGSWLERAAMTLRFIKEIYGVDENAEMKVRVFR